MMLGGGGGGGGGLPNMIAHDYTFPFPGIRLNEYGFYAADDWRVTKKLTLNYGIRWDYFSPPVRRMISGRTSTRRQAKWT